jgi:hypothetical protein
MLCVPAASALVLQAAVLVLPLPESGNAPQPLTGLPPSVTVTVPVGPLPLMLAVKVTLSPTCAGFSELVSVVVV